MNGHANLVKPSWLWLLSKLCVLGVAILCVWSLPQADGSACPTCTGNKKGRFSYNLVDVQYSSEWGSYGSGAAQLSQPFGVAVADGSIFVADSVNSRVQILNESSLISTGSINFPNTQVFAVASDPYSSPRLLYAGSTVFTLQPGAQPQQLIADWIPDCSIVSALSVSRNYIYASYQNTSGVFVINQYDRVSRNFIRQFAQGFQSCGIASANGRVFITDWANNAIKIFSETGELQRTLTAVGSPSDTSLNHPHGIAITGDLIHITDTNHNRVVVLKDLGNLEFPYVTEFGTFGSALGQLNFPKGLAIGSDGSTPIISDTSNNRLQTFKPVGPA